MTPGEGTKGSDIYRKVIREVMSLGESDDLQVSVTMVTGVCHNEQPADLEAGEGARVTPSVVLSHSGIFFFFFTVYPFPRAVKL